MFIIAKKKHLAFREDKMFFAGRRYEPSLKPGGRPQITIQELYRYKSALTI